MQRILIIQTAFIGDVVLATALIEKLQQHHPSAKIDFLLRKGNEALLAGHPLLNEVLVWNKKEKKLRNLFLMLRKIRARKYDAVINVQRFFATGLLTAFSGSPLKVGFDKNPLSFLFTTKVKHTIGDKSNKLHEVERNQLLIRSITDDLVSNPKLYPSSGDYRHVQQFQAEPYIVIAPASVWFTKQYPAEKWISFINKLPASQKIFLIGAPSDKAICDLIRSACPGKNVQNICGQLSLLQSAALQQGAMMNYVNDSAPMHFASAMNAPVTAVYCSTVPEFGYGPLSDKRTIIEVKSPLDCRPCGLHGKKKCPKQHFHCANLITDDQLLETLKS